MEHEWRVSATWAGTLDNEQLMSLADDAEHEWTVTRDPVGMEVVIYTAEPDGAVDRHVAAVEKWAYGHGLEGAVVAAGIMREDEFERATSRPSIPELASASDVAAILGVSRQRVHQLATENPRFPAAVAYVATGPLWTREQAEWFNSVWERKPGRPKVTA